MTFVEVPKERLEGGLMVVREQIIFEMRDLEDIALDHWFTSSGMCTPGGVCWAVQGYVKTNW